MTDNRLKATHNWLPPCALAAETFSARAKRPRPELLVTAAPGDLELNPRPRGKPSLVVMRKISPRNPARTPSFQAIAVGYGAVPPAARRRRVPATAFLGSLSFRRVLKIPSPAYYANRARDRELAANFTSGPRAFNYLRAPAEIDIQR